MRSARPVGRFALFGRGHPALLALIVASGALGFAFLALLLQLRPADQAPPADRGAALRSLAVMPFRGEDRVLAEAGQRLAASVARALADQMPQVRIAGDGDDARLRLEATLRGTDGDVDVALRVFDARDGRELAQGDARFPRTQLDAVSATSTVAANARRAVTSALFRLAAE